ncbi:MAG TPA: hypothetical protein VES95_14025 [Dermatophilaceae bacterium]|nr:hypothetical protein [Dermatophilaceae bacterium]
MTTSPPVSTVVQLKVRRPPLGPSLVPRERLVDAIEEGSRRRCTLVSAGAGFGKSVALSTWAAGHGSVEPVAWLSLDFSDSDPQRLCAHLLAAVQEALPPRPTSSGPPAVATDGGTARSPQAAHGAGGALPAQLSRVLELRPPPAAGRDFVEEALIPALQALGRPMVLVVDDVHVLASSPEALSILDTLLRWAPPEMRFVLAGRSDPPLALPRLRLAGQLTVLRQQHLGFTEDETVALLRGAGLRLTTGNERSLHELTHGWPAAVRLAAVSLAERGAVPEALEGVLTEDVALADYLASEVLHGLPAELSAFLLRATIDDLVCPDLVERVTGSADSVALLRACERRNLFLTRVDTDDGPDWYSWHQLFATLMRRRLEFSDPSEARRAHLAAADWWRTRDAVRAVEHAAEGRSQSLGLEILTETWPALALRGESGTLLDLVDLVPSGTDQEAEVRLATCYARLLHGDSASAATELARALAARDRLPAALVRRFDARAAWLRLSLVEERTSLRDVVRQARSLVDDPLTRRELSPTEYALACLATGIGQSRLQEDAVTALRTLRAAEEAGRVAHLDVLVFAARAEQGFPLIAEGRILEMQRSAAELVDDAARRGWASFGPLAMPRFVLGWLAHWRGDPTGALDQLEAAAACCPATDWALRGLISYFHGMASLVVGEMAAAEMDLKEARALAVAGCLPPSPTASWPASTPRSRRPGATCRVPCGPPRPAPPRSTGSPPAPAPTCSAASGAKRSPSPPSTSWHPSPTSTSGRSRPS